MRHIHVLDVTVTLDHMCWSHVWDNRKHTITWAVRSYRVSAFQMATCPDNSVGLGPPLRLSPSGDRNQPPRLSSGSGEGEGCLQVELDGRRVIEESRATKKVAKWSAWIKQKIKTLPRRYKPSSQTWQPGPGYPGREMLCHEFINCMG